MKQSNLQLVTICFIQSAYDYYLFHSSRVLDQVLDSYNNGVSKHLGLIADSMHEWEGPVAEQLGLTPADVAAIKMKYPGTLKLQT